VTRLTWIQRITLILFITVIANWVVASTTGYALLGSDLFTGLLILFLILLGLTWLRPLLRKFR